MGHCKMSYTISVYAKTHSEVFFYMYRYKLFFSPYADSGDAPPLRTRPIYASLLTRSIPERRRVQIVVR